MLIEGFSSFWYNTSNAKRCFSTSGSGTKNNNVLHVHFDITFFHVHLYRWLLRILSYILQCFYLRLPSSVQILVFLGPNTSSNFFGDSITPVFFFFLHFCKAVHVSFSWWWIRIKKFKQEFCHLFQDGRFSLCLPILIHVYILKGVTIPSVSFLSAIVSHLGGWLACEYFSQVDACFCFF